MDHPPREISFSAGLNSPDHTKARIVEQNPNGRLRQIVKAFPEVGEILSGWPMLVQAYPAPLGLRGADVTLADTYLRGVTVRSAIERAAAEGQDVVFVSQPLAGAELLLPALHGQLPKRMLWAVGGYYMPASLERTVVSRFRKRECDLSFLYSYGMAEIGHTCFAATHRDRSDLPRYRKIADEVDAMITNVNAAGVGQLHLKGPQNPEMLDTGDFAAVVGDDWTILSSPQRLADPVRNLLEAWTAAQWLRRTGYLYASPERLFYQLRRNHHGPVQPAEIPFYRFWEQFGGELLSKPNWGIQHAGR